MNPRTASLPRYRPWLAATKALNHARPVYRLNLNHTFL